MQAEGIAEVEMVMMGMVVFGLYLSSLQYL